MSHPHHSMSHHSATHHSAPTHHAAALLIASGSLLRAGIRSCRALSLGNGNKNAKGEDNGRHGECKHMLSHIDLLYKDHIPKSFFLHSTLISQYSILSPAVDMIMIMSRPGNVRYEK